jgi:hypothetical protein
VKVRPRRAIQDEAASNKTHEAAPETPEWPMGSVISSYGAVLIQGKVEVWAVKRSTPLDFLYPPSHREPHLALLQSAFPSHTRATALTTTALFAEREGFDWPDAEPIMPCFRPISRRQGCVYTKRVHADIAGMRRSPREEGNCSFLLLKLFPGLSHVCGSHGVELTFQRIQLARSPSRRRFAFWTT